MDPEGRIEDRTRGSRDVVRGERDHEVIAVLMNARDREPLVVNQSTQELCLVRVRELPRAHEAVVPGSAWSLTRRLKRATSGLCAQRSIGDTALFQQRPELVLW